MRKTFQVISIMFVFLVCTVSLWAKGSADSYGAMTNGLSFWHSQNEGETAFRSLLIAGGGRLESLGYGFTALANDSGFFFANPAASSTLKNTELAVAHNSTIADGNMETLSFSQRQHNLGYGSALRVFYIPFTQYDAFGIKKKRSFFSESFATFNVSYNFLAGYDFKGIAVGGNLKLGYRAMPSIYSLKNGKSPLDELLKAHSQDGFAVLADVGVQVRFNAGKFFYDREPNMHFGFAAFNFGAPIRGDLPPAYLSCGFSYRPVKLFLFSLGIQQPINLKAIKRSGYPNGSLAFVFSATDFFDLSLGIHFFGGNPRFSLASEINILPLQLVATYSLDFTTQATVINHFSVGVKIALGDGGRGKNQDEIEALFMQGLAAYNRKDFDEALAIWSSIIEKDPYFDPAIEAIEIVNRQKRVFAEVKKLDLQ